MRDLARLALVVLVGLVLVAVAAGAESSAQRSRGPAGQITARDLQGAYKVGRGLWRHRPAWLGGANRPREGAPNGSVQVRPGGQPSPPLSP
jgi:hypothetical protein